MTAQNALVLLRQLCLNDVVLYQKFGLKAVVLYLRGAL